MVQYVIARYNEDIEWVKHLRDPYVIYNKGETPIDGSIVLKNIGREGETFLYHIVHNYDRLDEVTVFLQGNPFDHLQLLSGWRVIDNDTERRYVIDKMNTEINNTTPFTTFYQVLYNNPPHVNGVNVREACQRWYGVDYTLFTTSPGAQYIVPKRYILSRPLEFWKTLHQAMYTDELDGYCQEALWYLAYMHRMNRHVGNHDQEKAKCEMIYSFSHELLRIDESA